MTEVKNSRNLAAIESRITDNMLSVGEWNKSRKHALTLSIILYPLFVRSSRTQSTILTRETEPSKIIHTFVLYNDQINRKEISALFFTVEIYTGVTWVVPKSECNNTVIAPMTFDIVFLKRGSFRFKKPFLSKIMRKKKPINQNRCTRQTRIES